MTGDKQSIISTKGKSKIKFDNVVNVGGSLLYRSLLKPRRDEVATAGMEKQKSNNLMY